MTVVIYSANKKAIYADGRTTAQNGLIFTDIKSKIKSFSGTNTDNKNPLNGENNCSFIIASSGATHLEHYIISYLKGEDVKIPSSNESTMETVVLFSSGDIYSIYLERADIIYVKLNPLDNYATGSGGEVALGVLHYSGDIVGALRTSKSWYSTVGGKFTSCRFFNGEAVFSDIDLGA